jgi:aminocarboxymuconate-semialdehyde decarboxylase
VRLPATPSRTIDVHTHILPPDLPDFSARTGDPRFLRLEHLDACRARLLYGDGTFFRSLDANAWDPRVRIEECDAAGVGVQVLSTVPVLFSYAARPAHALDLARCLNDHIAGVVRDRPDRFLGLGTLPMQDPDLALRELDRCMGELGLCGIEIGTHVNAWNLEDPALFPVFQRAEALSAAVFVHPWDMLGKESMPKYWLPWLVGMPAETARAICSLIFGGVLERLPRLRVLFAHGGGSFPGTFGRIEHGYRVRPDLCAVDNPRPPRDYLSRIFVDSLVHDPRALRTLIDLVGISRIAVGSDYPFPLGETRPGAILEALPELSREDRERLRWGTAREFLGDARVAT